MNKGRLLLFASAILCVLAVSAAPAFAQFEASKELKGAGTSGETTFEGGGGAVKCTKAEGTWTLAAKISENLKLNVVTWNECKTTTPLKAAAKLKACELQIHQATKGSTTATGTVLSECTISASGCEIHVKPESNKELKTVTLKNKGTNELEASASIEGITSTTSGLCGLVGIKGTKEAKLKGVSTAVGVIEI